MRTAALTVTRCGYAVVQDLGRPGHAAIGVATNGAGDRRSARTANALVGNADDAPLIEVIESDLELVTDSDLIAAVCGAADIVVVDGHAWPTWETHFVPAGARLEVPTPHRGRRSYLAVNGRVHADRTLGSVAPDPLLGVGRRLAGGDRLDVATCHDIRVDDHGPAVFRLGARPSRPAPPFGLRATPGPELSRLVLGADALGGPFEVLPRSDDIGVRFTGGGLDLSNSEEILSRGVPVGAVEVLPGGELVILMRGRLVTAGYPVVAVLTVASIDALAQARPGDEVRLSLVDLASARAELAGLEAEHRSLAERVARAFRARGLGHLLADRHAHAGGTRAR